MVSQVEVVVLGVSERDDGDDGVDDGLNHTEISIVSSVQSD